MGRTPSAAHQSLPTLFVATGSTSSDMLVAPLLETLRRRNAIGPVAGIGGTLLAEQGVRLFADATPFSSVGVAAGLKSLVRHAGSALAAYRNVARYFRDSPPALAILVDNAGNNLPFLALAQRYRIPAMYYVPPEWWSLWPWQVKAIVRRTVGIAAVFESEAACYRSRGSNAHWIGHPLIDLLPASPAPDEMVPPAPTIGLFPGSRRFEVLDLLPVLLGAARLLLKEIPAARFVVCSANSVVDRLISRTLAGADLPVELVYRNSHAVLARCDLLLTCSGTATLEAALLGVPQVTMYRIHHWLDRLIRPFLVDYSFLALPNLILKRPLVPELVRAAITPARVAAEGLALLQDTAKRQALFEGYAEVRERLGPPGAVERAADLVEELLGRRLGGLGDLGDRVPARHREVAAHHVR